MAVHRLFAARNKTRCPSFEGCLTMGRAMSAYGRRLLAKVRLKESSS